MSAGSAGLRVGEAKALALASWDGFAAALRVAGQAAAVRPTRLAGWTVEDLVRHTAWGMSMEAEALRLAVVAEGARHGARAAGRVVDGLAGDALDLAWHRARAELAAGFDVVGDVVRRGAVPVLPLPYGDVPLAVALDTFVMEAAVHGDDLRAALVGHAEPGDGPDAGPDAGLDAGARAEAVPAPLPPLDPRVVPSCARFVQHFWPVLASLGTPVRAGTTLRLVGRTIVLGGTFDGASWLLPDPLRPPGPEERPPGAGPTVTLRGDDSTVLRVALGRGPVTASGLHVDGDAALAAALKEHVPGP